MKKILSIIAISFLLFLNKSNSYGSESLNCEPQSSDKSAIEKVENLDDLMFPATSMPDRDWWEALWPNPLELVLKLNLTEEMSVLDLCCGYGYFTLPLSSIASTIYGLELEAELIDQAKHEALTRGITKCHWIVGDAMRLRDLMPEPVDYILLANTFHGIPNKPEFATNAISMLKPSGRLSIINWHKKPREETTVLGKARGPQTTMRMSPEEVIEILSPLGLELESLVELPPYHYGIVFRKP